MHNKALFERNLLNGEIMNNVQLSKALSSLAYIHGLVNREAVKGKDIREALQSDLDLLVEAAELVKGIDGNHYAADLKGFASCTRFTRSVKSHIGLVTKHLVDLLAPIFEASKEEQPAQQEEQEEEITVSMMEEWIAKCEATRPTEQLDLVDHIEAMPEPTAGRPQDVNRNHKIRTMLRQGKSIDEIVSATKSSKRQVYLLKAEMYGKSKRGRKIDPDDYAIVTELTDKGYSIRMIVEITNISRATVCRYRAAYKKAQQEAGINK